jgi:hypothetical protein
MYIPNVVEISYVLLPVFLQQFSATIRAEECRATAQAVSHRLLTAEARVSVLVSQCGICGGQSGSGTGSSPSSSVPPVSIIPP